MKRRHQLRSQHVAAAARLPLHVQHSIACLEQQVPPYPEARTHFDGSQRRRVLRGSAAAGILYAACLQPPHAPSQVEPRREHALRFAVARYRGRRLRKVRLVELEALPLGIDAPPSARPLAVETDRARGKRSEEHTSEL